MFKSERRERIREHAPRRERDQDRADSRRADRARGKSRKAWHAPAPEPTSAQVPTVRRPAPPTRPAQPTSAPYYPFRSRRVA